MLFGEAPPEDLMSLLVDVREYDVQYTMRCAIDLDLRVGAWYRVTPVKVGRMEITIASVTIESMGAGV